MTHDDAPQPEPSAMDHMIDFYDRAQHKYLSDPEHRRECDDCWRAEKQSADARAELAALRRERDDAEARLVWMFSATTIAEADARLDIINSGYYGDKGFTELSLIYAKIDAARAALRAAERETT